MKKLFIFFAVVVLSGMITKVSAQVSTGINPAPGATHNYFVTDNGHSVLWTVTKGDLTTSAGTDVVMSENDAYSIDITWASTVLVGDWYYVHVVESDGTCTNEKVLPVQIIASPFSLILAAANATQCYDGAVAVSIDGSDSGIINYDHGNTTIEFTVTPAGLSPSYSGYSFDINLVVPDGCNATPSFSGNASVDSGTVTVTDNDEVIITYTVDNTNVYTNETDPDGDAADYTAVATISGGKAINGVSDNGSGTKTDETAVSRPHTSGIGTN